jgi:tRNA threonylcarbamoyl adenosine modification protein (Sua5/YciO/YrdC/YwlC family)
MADPFDRAIDHLRHGGLVVYPTDTLYGLGADARNEEAVHRLIAAKGRAGTQPISVAVSSFEEVERLGELSRPARAFLRSNLPGPFTVLLPAARDIGRLGLAPPIQATGTTVGIRLPDHPLARALARAIGPITATSANRHGEPPCRTLAQARRTFGDEVDAYLDGAPRPTGRPSTLVDWTRRDSPELRTR